MTMKWFSALWAARVGSGLVSVGFTQSNNLFWAAIFTGIFLILAITGPVVRGEP